MSFLVTEEDKWVLNEAFALIEACDGETSPAGVDTTDDSSDLEHVPSLEDLVDVNSIELLDASVTTQGPKSTSFSNVPCANATKQEPEPKPTKKRRVRNAETSSTGLQRRKRAELASLREQVEELQGVIAQLKCSLSLVEVESSSSSEKSRRTQWHNHAIEQNRLRLQAEKDNRHLKAIMKKHNKVREALCGVLQKRSVLYGLDYLMETDVPTCGAAFSDVGVWMAQLENTAEHLCLLSRSRLEMEQQPVLVNTSMQTKYDERRKMKIIEFETTTPLNCPLQVASNFLWRDFQSDRTLGVKPDTLVKKAMLTMPSCKGSITAEKLHFVRKYQDADRTLLTWADIMVLPAKRDFQFRTEGMILLAPSRTNPEQTVSRSYLKLYLDTKDGDRELRPEDVAYAQDIVLGAMAMKLRLYWQSFQNMMIEGASRTPNIQIPA
ncbi:hypothetical protein PHYPSEUDO_009835 [Phytophthora pseudosyringae]|uniref:M96 mating-specific protein family n=1 Tax=Phytophthora pseudosyringae TaxID=221518 RepID=A0A8T1WBQ2_9STRA|nr:hypothetical protein PHYPSEUDO_009835 [Phytophthora pseudosyringae]